VKCVVYALFTSSSSRAARVRERKRKRERERGVRYMKMGGEIDEQSSRCREQRRRDIESLGTDDWWRWKQKKRKIENMELERERGSKRGSKSPSVWYDTNWPYLCRIFKECYWRTFLQHKERLRRKRPSVRTRTTAREMERKKERERESEGGETKRITDTTSGIFTFIMNVIMCECACVNNNYSISNWLLIRS